MDLDLKDRSILCVGETGYNNWQTIHNFLEHCYESTIYCWTWNPSFFILLRNITDFLDIPLVIKHPYFNDTDDLVHSCDTLAFFSDGKDAETNEMLYTLLEEEDSIYEKIIVCNSDGVGVYEVNTS